jgi:hypothetical protein
MSNIDELGLRLPPSLWSDGHFPTLEQYRQVFARGRMLYSLDIVDADMPGAVGPAIADRPANLLYHNGGTGFSKPRPGGFGTPGFGRNEWLLPGVVEQRSYIASIHQHGIPVLVYQSDNNFDRTVFSDEESNSFAAELDPFSWAFGTVGRTFACVNKPAWRQYLAARLEIRVGQYGADGVFLDNTTPFIHCRCQHCRRLYRDRFGPSADLDADMGRPETVVADMRVFDYAYGRAVPKNLARIDSRALMRYLEWRIERIIDFYHDMRDRVQTLCRRPVLWTTNGHIGIAEFTALNIAETTDMIFSEEGFSAPPASNAFALRLGTAVGRGQRCMFVLTRVIESAPTADMVSVLSAEGRALGGQASFWDCHLRADDRLAAAERAMRQFFIEHAHDIFIPERDANDAAILMSYRSDLWTSQAVSPARHVADLLEDMNQPYDVLLPERDDAIESLPNYKLIVAPHTEILSNQWFDALQRYLDGGGWLITTGNTAALDEHLQSRPRNFRGQRLRQFDQRLEKQYADARKPVGIHNAFTQPQGEFAQAISDAMKEASIIIDPPQPLLAVNHTALPDGQAIHLVNRHVNLFTRIRLRRREGLHLRITPRRKVSQALWLTPDAPPVPLPVTSSPSPGTPGEGWGGGSARDGSTPRISLALPPLGAYAIIRLIYERV